jgi:GNAT superfamily N-acetyltransferase
VIVVREAIERDYTAISRLIGDELGYSDLLEAETIRRLEHISSKRDWATFVAVTDDEVVGFIGVMMGLAYNAEGYYAQIMALAVSEKSQRLGVGTELTKAAEEWALSQGVSDISVSSNIKRLKAHAFYEKKGYAKVKENHLFIKPLQTR